jgi:MSHA biogenesis protein MshQ
MPNSFEIKRNSALIRCILFLILACISELVAAVTYNLSTGFYPPCTTNWNVSGTTHTCVGSGNVTLAAGDIIIANSTSTIVARGLTLGSNTTIGSASANINLSLGSDPVTSAGPAIIYGSLDSSANVTLVNTTVNGSINTPATINLTGGNVTGSVTSSSNGITTSNTTIGGAVTANGNINLTGGSVGGLVTSIGNTITTNGTNLSGGARAQSGMSITGGTVAGNFTMTSNNAAIFSGVTMTSGTISGASTVTIQNGSLLGSSSASISINSTSNEITVNNSTVYGNLTAPNYSTVYVTNGGRVFGVCLPGSTPANACGPAPKPPINSCSTTLTAGITGKYYNNMLATGTVVATRSDGPINFDWGQGAPGPAGVNMNNFSANWEGYLRVTQSGNYRFQTNSDDGIRLTVNGELLINQWNDHPVTTHTSSVVVLEAGTAYPIKLEFYENGGYAVAQLLWQTPAGASYVAIPKGSSPAANAGLYECVPGPTAYSLSHNSQGITCQAEAITVTALDASKAAYKPPAGTTVILSSSSAVASWVGGNTYVFTGVESSFTKYLQQTSPAFLQIKAESATASGTSNITFLDTLLKITQTATVDNIPTQVAGVNGSAMLRVMSTNPKTGVCEAKIPSGSRTVELAFSCNNPVNCISGQTFSVNGSAVVANNNSASLAYSNMLMTFNTNAQAPLTINYSDVGQVTLHGRLTIPQSGNDPAVTISGSSNPFVVKPYTLVISTVAQAASPYKLNPGTTNSGNGFITAGEKFTVNVQSRNFQGSATPNFGNEILVNGLSQERNKISLQMGCPERSQASDPPCSAGKPVYPTGGTTGSLVIGEDNNADSVRDPYVFLSAGAAIPGVWSEVGTFRLEPFLDGEGYLGQGNVSVITPSGIVGRFYPAKFQLESPLITNSCGSAFSYMEHPNIKVAYKVSALNKNNEIVRNYDNKNLNYVAAGVDHVVKDLSAIDSMAVNKSVRFGIANIAQWESGVLNFKYDNGIFYRARNADGNIIAEPPYKNNMQLGVKFLLGSDPVSMNMNMNAEIVNNCSGNCNASVLGTFNDIRFGRLRLDSSFGSGAADLPVNFITEYWTGSLWIKNTDDSCTKISRSNIFYGTPEMSISNSANLNVPLTGGATIGIYGGMDASSINFVAGDARHRFSAPGINATGLFAVRVDMMPYPWLMFDWNQINATPTIDKCPSDADCNLRATFSFGSYRGHDRIIYWREKFN